MSRDVFLHVGLPKSGTSFVQKVLTSNKEQLKDAGLLFPGASWADQVRAVREVRRLQPTSAGTAVGGAWQKVVATTSSGTAVGRAWQKLVTEVSTWPGDAIISMEWLGAASPHQIEVILEDLSPARVQVIFTARDLARTIPAAWQEFMQNRAEWSWPEFLDSVTADDRQGTAGVRFWAQQDLAALLARWTSLVAVEQVHVVTLPHPGAPQETLWKRMCQVLGERGSVDLAVSRGNESLGLESAELMRGLNRHVRAVGVSRAAYNRSFKHELAKNILAQRKDEDSKLVLPQAHHAWVRRQAEQQIEALAKSGVDVVGDADELRPVLQAGAGEHPDEVSIEVLLETSLSTLATVVQQWDQTRISLHRLQTQSRRLQAKPGRVEARRARNILRTYASAARARLATFRSDRR